MSGGGDGNGFFDDIEKSLSLDLHTFKGKGNFFDNLKHDILSQTVQYASGGLLSYKDGKLAKGASTELLEEFGKATLKGTKEVTGAKAAEEANQMAREQFEEQKIAAEQDRQNAIITKGREQVQASQLAGAARRAGTTNNSLLGSDEKDFLGL